MSTYDRLEPTPEDVNKFATTARRIVSQKTLIQVAAIMLELMKENARLTAEVNDHRAARGFELLPVHDATIKS